MKYIPIERVETGRTGYQQQVKETNIKRIFDLVRFGRCKSRAEIVRCMNLSATSVSVLVEELMSRGLVEEVGPAQTTMPGRRPISLRLNSDARQMATFALSRDGVRYCLLDLECRVVESHTYPLSIEGLTDAETGEAYVRLFEQVLKRRSKRFDSARALMIGICFPGVFLENRKTYSSGTELNVSIPEGIFEDFGRRMGLPLCVINSTRCKAYAEKRFLDARDPDAPETEYMLYADIHKGINCAVIAKGSIYTGPHNISGLLGHFTIDYQGRPCHCGNRGCLERYVNQDTLLEDAQKACVEAGTQPPADLKEAARRCADEPALMAALQNSARLLAFGLYNLMCSSGMNHIVLSGIEALGDAFLEEVRRALMERTLLVCRLDLSWAQAGRDSRNVGICQYFLDKVFTITG